jgi:hypothetical protein
MFQLQNRITTIAMTVVAIGQSSLSSPCAEPSFRIALVPFPFSWNRRPRNGDARMVRRSVRSYHETDRLKLVEVAKTARGELIQALASLPINGEPYWATAKANDVLLEMLDALGEPRPATHSIQCGHPPHDLDD